MHVCGCASVTIYVRSCVPTSVCAVRVRLFRRAGGCVPVCAHACVGLVCNQMFGCLSYSPIVIGLPCIYCKLNQGVMNLIKTCWLRSKM